MAGSMMVHIPFSLSDLGQIERRLGSFSDDPTHHTKEFRYLTQIYVFTYQNVYIILSSTTTQEEKDHIWAATTAQADKLFTENPDKLGNAGSQCNSPR